MWSEFGRCMRNSDDNIDTAEIEMPSTMATNCIQTSFVTRYETNKTTNQIPIELILSSNVPEFCIFLAKVDLIHGTHRVSLAHSTQNHIQFVYNALIVISLPHSQSLNLFRFLYFVCVCARIVFCQSVQKALRASATRSVKVEKQIQLPREKFNYICCYYQPSVKT